MWKLNKLIYVKCPDILSAVCCFVVKAIIVLFFNGWVVKFLANPEKKHLRTNKIKLIILQGIYFSVPYTFTY